jgi:hypothetical protein
VQKIQAAIDWFESPHAPASAGRKKVRKLYSYLGIPERTAMAFFDGPHMIHGGETFEFLHRQIKWPNKR